MDNKKNIVVFDDIDQIVSTTHNTVNRLLKEKNWPDALALYFRYIQQRKQQTNSQTFSTDTFMRKATWRGSQRFWKAKKILIDWWFIEKITVRDESWKIKWHYVKVNFVIETSPDHHNTETHSMGKPDDGKATHWETSNKYLSKKQNTSINKQNTSIEKEDIYIYPQVRDFIDHKAKEFAQIRILINKQWEEYYEKSSNDYRLLLKDLKEITDDPEKIATMILLFVMNDDFRKNNILSIAKLRKKNSSWVKYRVVMIDKMNEQQKKSEIAVF